MLTNGISETIMSYWSFGRKTKTTPSGWVSGNAVCCSHNGHSVDKRSRGGMMISNDQSISYSCFNCGFKASWKPGRQLSVKMKKLLEWIGATDEQIKKLSFEAIKIENSETKNNLIHMPLFKTKDLPKNCIKISDDCSNNSVYLSQVKQYMKSRGLHFDQEYDYFWSSEIGLRDRFIIPFLYKNQIVGWISRTAHNRSNKKYLLNKQPGFVFNMDQQTPDKIFCIAVEGVLDAINIHGVALLSNQISNSQAMMLNSLNKQIIVVPDRDLSGQDLVERSIELGYSVSMPDWKNGIKDVSDAVLEYGRLYTLYSIVKSVETNPLKIRLKQKRWFDNIHKGN